nr:pyruvate kinase [Niabella ginsengisoli]
MAKKLASKKTVTKVVSKAEETFARTKIVATVGPASNTYDKLKDLVKAGVNVFRLNFSHGEHDEKKKIIEYIRQINKKKVLMLLSLAICKALNYALEKLKVVECP